MKPLAAPQDDKIPRNTGKNTITNARLNLTLGLYWALVLFAVASFYFDLDPRVQHAGLSLLIPGGSFIGYGGFWILGFPLTMTLFALSLFLWFATGNIIAPFLTWPGLGLIMPFLPISKTRVKYSIFVTPLLAAVIYFSIRQHMAKVHARRIKKRDERNDYLPRVLPELRNIIASKSDPDNLEIPAEELGQLRYLIQVALQDHDDWRHFTIIDQYQPAALRYQLCELNYTIGLANKLYTPSFRGGYLQEAQKNCVLKYCQKKVLNYWKWESLWGKMTTNFDPIVKDNIMLTGFYLLALGIYEAATGDTNFNNDDSLTLVIDESHRYKNSTKTLCQALINNYEASPYSLYSCEPNWIYPYCNFHALNGLRIHDTNNGTDHTSRYLNDLRKGLIEEFTTIDGTTMPIKSLVTGFTIPGLAGATNDFGTAALLAAVMPDISLRSYAIARNEYIDLGNKETVTFRGLTGADLIDPGNYQASNAFMYTSSLFSAREYGDDQLAVAIKRTLDQDETLERVEKDGLIWYNKASLFLTSQLLRARLNVKGGWRRVITEKMSDKIKHGPYLCQCKYPEVLVAKAITHTGEDLDLVLYPGTHKKTNFLELKQLKPNQEYAISGGNKFTANASGNATIEVNLSGRTPVHIVPS